MSCTPKRTSAPIDDAHRPESPNSTLQMDMTTLCGEQWNTSLTPIALSPKQPQSGGDVRRDVIHDTFATEVFCEIQSPSISANLSSKRVDKPSCLLLISPYVVADVAPSAAESSIFWSSSDCFFATQRWLNAENMEVTMLLHWCGRDNGPSDDSLTQRFRERLKMAPIESHRASSRGTKARKSR